MIEMVGEDLTDGWTMVSGCMVREWLEDNRRYVAEWLEVGCNMVGGHYEDGWRLVFFKVFGGCFEDGLRKVRMIKRQRVDGGMTFGGLIED